MSKQSGQLCPVNAMLQYVKFRGAKPGPLFLNSVGVPVSYDVFRKFCKLINSYLPGDARITGHSFRIVGATYASQLGLNVEEVMRIGRWSSSAFKRYTRIQSFKVPSMQ